jgi:hypothetical protein
MFVTSELEISLVFRFDGTVANCKKNKKNYASALIFKDGTISTRLLNTSGTIIFPNVMLSTLN